MEGPQPAVDQSAALNQLICADLFEQVLQQRYLGTQAIFAGRRDRADSTDGRNSRVPRERGARSKS